MINGKRGICHAMPWRAISFRCSFLRRALCAESEWFQWKGGRKSPKTSRGRARGKERGRLNSRSRQRQRACECALERPGHFSLKQDLHNPHPYLEFYENCNWQMLSKYHVFPANHSPYFSITRKRYSRPCFLSTLLNVACHARHPILVHPFVGRVLSVGSAVSSA